MQWEPKRKGKERIPEDGMEASLHSRWRTAAGNRRKEVGDVLLTVKCCTGIRVYTLGLSPGPRTQSQVNMGARLVSPTGL